MTTIAPRKTGRIARILTAAGIALGLSLGTVAVAAPAQAATAVSFCMTWGGTAYANQPVYLKQWTGAKWVSIRSGKTNASGCGTFYSTPSGVYLGVQGYTVLNAGRISKVYDSGNPQVWATPGNGGVNLGTIRVNLAYSYYN